MQTYTAGIIGTGRIGFLLQFDKKREQPASHTSALNNNKRIKLCAACDSDLERLTLWQKKNKKCRTYENQKDFFEAELNEQGKIPDIVTVAVNEDAHLETAINVIEHKPRLMILEKPVALNVADAMKIKSAAEKNNVPVLINHERRFAADYAQAKAFINKIGEIQNVNAVLSSGLRVYAEKEEQTGLYSLIHDGTHLVDTVRYLLSSEDYNCCFNSPVVEGIFRDSENMVRNVSVHYSTDVCPSVSFVFSGRSKYFGFDIDIRGTNGRVEIGNGYLRFFENRESKLYSGFKSLALSNSAKFTGKTGYFSLMVQNAVDFLDGKAKLGSTIDDGIETLKTLEEIKSFLK